MFATKNFAIYILDDHRVFVGIDGGIIGDIQLNETYIRNWQGNNQKVDKTLWSNNSVMILRLFQDVT